jgi:hypothetical protein
MIDRPTAIQVCVTRTNLATGVRVSRTVIYSAGAIAAAERLLREGHDAEELKDLVRLAGRPIPARRDRH